jgi:hypothetical protein
VVSASNFRLVAVLKLLAELRVAGSPPLAIWIPGVRGNRRPAAKRIRELIAWAVFNFNMTPRQACATVLLP